MTLEEWYKLPEYVRTRMPCPVLLKDTVTNSPITKKIKEVVYDRTLCSSAGDLSSSKDILPSSRFVCKKKHTASKDITPSPPKPRWRYVSKSSMSKASTKADIKLLNLLSPRKMQWKKKERSKKSCSFIVRWTQEIIFCGILCEYE